MSKSKEAGGEEQGQPSVAAAPLLVFAKIEGGFADRAAGAMGDGETGIRVHAGERLNQFRVGRTLCACVREIGPALKSGAEFIASAALLWWKLPAQRPAATTRGLSAASPR